METETRKERKSAGNRGLGRKKGSKNKTTALLKDAILMAAEAAGTEMGKEGMVGYLTLQAQVSPAAFLSLLGKVLPTQLTGDPDAPLEVKGLLVSFVKPDEPSEG
jgi:hypothetical protein